MHSKDRTNPFLNRQPLKTGGRAIFLERIRKSLGHAGDTSPAPTTPPPERDESLIRQVAKDDPQLLDRWIAKATGNGMTVHRIAATTEAVHAAIALCFANHEVTKCVLNARDFGDRFALPACLANNNIQQIPWGTPAAREEAYASQASITDCRAACADTGSLFVWSDPAFGRTTTLVVPVHIVLLPVSRVLPDLIDALALAHSRPASDGGDGRLPSNIVVINGPSKTADIEMNLVTGVHGPKFLYVLLLDGI